MDEMLHHTKAVVRGTKHALIVGDMPFLSYSTPEDAVANAGRFLREGGTQAVKVEGGVRSARTIEALVRAGHPGHGPHRADPAGDQRDRQGPRPGQDARAGARRCSPTRSRSRRPARSRSCWSWCPGSSPPRSPSGCRIPTIGIGAGAGCSGQIQVITDTLGWGDWTPKHARRYADLRGTILGAVSRTRRTSRPASSPPMPRRSSWIPRCWTRSSVGPSRTAPPRRLGSPGSRSTATSSDRQPGPPRDAGRPHPRRAPRAPSPSAPRPVGFVPTMGWLHAGHRSLMRAGAAANATVVVSIFVNPRQFGEAADFARYPRNEARDLAICEAAGVDVVFAPPVDEVYRRGSTPPCPWGPSRDRSRGRRGRATSTAWRRWSRSCSRSSGPSAPTSGSRTTSRSGSSGGWRSTSRCRRRSWRCDTVREPDGLAMSSRNARLSPEGRAAAPVIRRALLAGAACVLGGERVGGRRASGDVVGPREEPLAAARLRVGRRSGHAR